MSWRWLLWIIPAIVVVSAVVAWRWLLYSESGAAWALGMATEATDGAIQAEVVQGSIAAGLTIRGFSFDNEGVRVEIAEVALNANANLIPLSVRIRSAQVRDADIELRSSGAEPEEGTDIREVLRLLDLPLAIDIDDLRVTDISIGGPSGGEPLRIESAELSALWDDRIEVKKLLVRAPAGAVSANGYIALQDIYELALNAQVDIESSVTGSADVVPVAVAVEGSLDAMSFDIAAMNSSLTGRLSDLSGDAHVDAQLDSPRLTWPFAAVAPIVELRDIVVSVNGGFSAYQAEADASVELPGLEMIEVVLQGNGDENRFDAESLVVNGGEVEGSAAVGWRDGLSASIDARLTSLALVRWIEDWTGAHVLDGTVSVSVTPDSLDVSESNIVVVDGERRLELNGNVDVRGDADEWTLGGEIGVATNEFPSGTFVLSGSGSRERVVLDELNGNLLGGTVEGRASFSWIDSRAWSAELDIQNLDTGSLPFDWPANISGAIDAQGQVQPLEASILLQGIEGSLLAAPFSATGTLNYSGGEISARNLDVRHGDSRVYLDGELTTPAGFSFDARVSELADYVDTGSGAFVLAGRASLNSANPFFDVVGSSEQISWGDLSMVDVRLLNGQGSGLIADIDLEIGTLTQGAYQFEAIALDLDIAKDHQVAALSAASSDFQIGISAAGALDDWTSPSRWSGEVSHFEIAEGDRSAALVEPSDIEVGREEIVLSGFCLESVNGLYACADLRRSVSGALELVTELRSLPVNIVNQFVDTRLEFDQTVSGNFAWRQSADGRINGSADIDLTAGTIVSRARPESPVATEAGGVSFDIVDNDLQSGLVALPLPAGGRVDGRFEVDDVDDGRDADVAGNLTIDLPDLAAIDALIPWLDEVSGSLDVAVSVAGTLQAPSVSGDVSLVDGVIRYEPIGLRLRDVTLQSSLDPAGELQLNGEFLAGEGRGEILTYARSGENPGIEAEIRGAGLTLVDLPDISIVVEPDVIVGFDGRTLSLDGNIQIPSARVRPQNITVTRVTESSDVIVVAGELPTSAGPDTESGDIRIEGELDVAFGDDVQVLLDVASTNLTGSAAFTWSGDPIPMANGRYDLSGTILAFGQRLEIDEGGVRFPNVPADNPVIRIRAIREIFGNTEVREAGVQVAGSARRPAIETFTVPATTEERALTLLITGSDFDYEQGVGAVDFGTYIAPKLYASYGIGLFEQENVIRLRYDIARGFGVTVTSGQKENGLDLTYRFEN